jgi:phage-related protein
MDIYSNKYVNEFILDLTQVTQAKTQHSLDLLEKFGNQLRMPHVRKLESPLFELRIRGKQEIRILFVYLKNSCYLLHGFIKKTQHTPKKEMNTALERFSVLK